MKTAKNHCCWWGFHDKWNRSSATNIVYCHELRCSFNMKSSKFWSKERPKGSFLTSWEDILMEVIVQFQPIFVRQLPITRPDRFDKLNAHLDECLLIIAGRGGWRPWWGNHHLGTLLKVFLDLIGLHRLWHIIIIGHLLLHIFDILLLIVFFKVLMVLLLMISMIYQMIRIWNIVSAYENHCVELLHCVGALKPSYICRGLWSLDVDCLPSVELQLYCLFVCLFVAWLVNI